MKLCPQTDTQSVYDHGISVWEYTQRILSKDWEGMRIPESFSTNFDYIVSNIYDLDTIRLYNIYHDCGKPYCIEYDAEGRRHFPNHAEVSFRVFLENSGEILVANLIRDDMMLHTGTAEEIKELFKNKKHLMTLVVTALAEIHSNAKMFGGIESTSFKIKYKKLEQRIKQCVKVH